MKFIDTATISVEGGRGGNGCISFRREKYVPKGGPNGGNGGDGGNVIIKADRNLSTLLDFRYKRHYKAKRGEHGKGSNKHGKRGKNVYLRVPVGTVIREEKTSQLLADFTEHDQEIVVAKGGRGGKGNAEFATPTNRTPRHAEPGGEGEERSIIFELKLLADVGLVGLPNAGKSTLISRISAAKPKIADYPFTTLIPNLGIVTVGEFKTLTVADIPGLISGAHQGKGLGIQFLRHIERTTVLAFLIEATDEKPHETFETLVNELRQFNTAILEKSKILVFTKSDIIDGDHKKKLASFSISGDIPTIVISAVTGDGISDFIELAWEKLSQERAANGSL